MRGVEEHLAAVLTGVGPLAALDVPLLEARGCLLAEPLRAPWALPPFDSTSAAGYAVRAADTASASEEAPVRLKVVDDVPAGYRATRTVGPGEAIRIGSGAPVPVGADAVAGLSQTDAGMPVVSVSAVVGVGENIRPAGTDLSAGEVVLEEGARIGSREVALLAAVGCGRLHVRPRPRVVVISTGTELVEPGEELTPGLIPDSTGYLLTAAAEDAGAMAFRIGPVADNPQALRSVLEDQLVRADLMVTTGGIAAQTYDTLRLVVADFGRVDFTRVAMTPGMAQGHGHLGPDRIPLFTLPGSPMSAFVAFEAFVRPVIRRMLGRADPIRRLRMGRLLGPIRGAAGFTSYHPARLDSDDGQTLVIPLSQPGMLGLRLADCLVVLDEAVSEAPAGTDVSILPIGPE